MRMVICGRGCDCDGPAFNCRARRRVRAMVLFLSRRLVLVTALVDTSESDTRILARSPCYDVTGGQ